MKVFLIAALAAIWLLPAPRPATACSQCMCGSPFPLTFLSAPMPSSIRYGVEDQYLSKSSGLDPAGTESEVGHRVAPFVLYRPDTRVFLQLRAPYTFKRITAASEAGSDLETSHGFGEAELTAHLVVHQTLDGSVALIAGATAPTGQNWLKDSDGELLDTHLQAGSGAWSGLLGLEGALRAPGGSWDASVLFRTNSRSARGYQYGRVALFNAGYVHDTEGAWQWSLQLQGRSAAVDDDNSITFAADNTWMEGTIFPVANTGGSILYLAPLVRIGEATGLSINLGAQLPLVRSLKGVQSENPTARISISFSPE